MRKDAAPGEYRGSATVKDGQGHAAKLALSVMVRPFELLRPKGIHWGLYPDTARWRGYSEGQIRAELAGIARHGITTLMLYPVNHSKITYENGKLHVDASELIRQVKLAKEAGLGPPWVMSLQSLYGRVRQLLPGKTPADAEFGKLYRAIAGEFIRTAREKEFGECVWHAVDEPWAPETLRRAISELGWLKQLGVETFTTAGPVSPELDRVLDVRCYGIGHLLSTPGVLEKGRRETAAAKDRLWFYGSGCYTGQDGNVIGNRFVTGFLFYRSGAEGEWSWTFLRPKGNVYDDFDGDAHREHKDACTVYPSAGKSAPTPTLQWEGIREGIDDYCYAWTLAETARRKGGPEGRKATEELGRLMAGVPIRRSPGDFTAADAQRLRTSIAGLIEKLTP